MRRFLVLSALIITALPAFAQTTEQKEAEEDRKQFGKFEVVTKDWNETKGLLRLYRKEKEERLLAAIPKALLAKPLFLATSVSGGSDYAGWQWEDKLVHFERFGKKILLVELNTRQRAAKDKPVAEVVRRTYADRLLASMDIKSIGPDGEVIIDLGTLLSREFRTFFGGLFSMNTSLARFTKTKTFPKNVEVAVQMPLFGDGTFVSLHYSISELPKLKNYTPRLADERLGYFLTPIRDYTDGDPQEGRMVRQINRWKLEKADPDLALSPPKEPIVFYIEKTVPIAYRRAVAEGILEWNRAFEQVGVVGAIEVRQQRETQFNDLDPEDVRFNFFRWITSESAFAMGPSRVDPRTGRILDADIIFDDSMLRGYMRDYDTLLRDGPDKMLTRPMRRILERNPQRHPMARFRASSERDARLERTRQTLLDLTKGSRGVLRDALIKSDTIENREDLATLPLRVQNADACRIGEFLPHKVGLMGLAIGRVGKDGPGTAISKAAYDDYLSQIVKETVMHEVGHTLGLRHNFQASSMFDLDMVNGDDRPEVLSASVMDYHPVNLYPTRSDGKPQGFFLTRTIGPYDMLAIEYGYKLCKEDDAELAKVARRVAEKKLPYATDEDLSSPDPSIAQWDLGDDPIKFGQTRLLLVQELWKGLEKRTVDDNQSFSKLRRALDITLFEVQSSSVFVARQVGGLNFSRDRRGDPGARAPMRVVDVRRQRESLKWVCDNIFAADALNVPRELQDKLAASRWVHWGTRDGSASLEYSLLDRILQIQTWVLFMLSSDDVLARVWENEERAKPGEDVLTLPELFETLESSIFNELKGDIAPSSVRKPAVTSRRQNLQDAYVRQLISIALARDTAPPVASKLAWSRLEKLEGNFAGLLEAQRLDPYTRAHLQVLGAQSNAARNARYVHVASGVSGCSLDPTEEPGAPWGLMLIILCASVALIHQRTKA